MVQAYILVQIGSGQVDAVKEKIAGLPDVTSVAAVIGPYDLIVRAEAIGITQLTDAVVLPIQFVPGVIRTVTCPILRP